jgi:hypothetical protein
LLRLALVDADSAYVGLAKARVFAPEMSGRRIKPQNA